MRTFDSWYEELLSIAEVVYCMSKDLIDNLDKNAFLWYYHNGYQPEDALVDELDEIYQLDGIEW